MKNTGTCTKVLAAAGTALAAFPVVATIVLSIIGSISRGMLLFDFLMPAELFLFGLVGGLLLLWAVFRSGTLRKSIGWGLAAAAVFLASAQGIAIVSGLAHGDTEPVGLLVVVVIGFIVLYTLAVIEIGIAGILLCRKLFAANKPSL